MKVLALASYPIEAAATRYRLAQFVSPLAERGITLEVHPFIDSRLFASLYKREALPFTAARLVSATLGRLKDVWRARDVDLLLVQREAMLFGPPLIEWLVMRVGSCPMVLDLDDATYLPYVSPVYGRLASALKWFSKTDDLISWAKVVTCGNRTIANYVESKGVETAIIPTVVDTDRFRPKSQAEQPSSSSQQEDVPVIGWVGTHSTYPYLETIFPVLQQLARSHRFRLKVVGAGREHVDLPGVKIENLKWDLAREVEDFQSFDIGLYPIVESEWAAGKSGFKAIQYMAVGVPYVVTPVGSCAEIGEAGVTHLCASTLEEWHAALERLLEDAELRRQMGEAGRRHTLQYYTVPVQSDKLAEVLRRAVSA
ncbi:MAG TPA: glycosyltransferase family 4 protein [Pyrinomonadaceae bacterium]|nr:glycosyltransferase family 4 protein [Pyrinomonadaceae bacterium]